MTEVDLCHVGLSQIDLGDCTFELRSFSDSNRLADSLARAGILDPVWLGEKSGKFFVVDGFKRLRWAKDKGSDCLFCRIFKEGCDLRRVWVEKLEKRLCEGEINLAEKAQIIAVLAELFGPGEIPGFFLSGLKAANRPEAIRKWLLLAGKGPRMLEALASGEVCERAAMEISDWDDPGFDSVLALLRALKCSASIQVEIVERISEIAIRQESSRAAVLELAPVREILSREMNHREKTAALRQYLAEVRNPRLSLRRKRFQRELEALGLPLGARVVPPEAFEGGEWSMQLSFTRPEELRKIFRLAEPVVASNRLDKVFEK